MYKTDGHKKFKLDLKQTLASLPVGESVEFVIAGEGRETTGQTLNNTRATIGRKYKIETIDNGLRAVVTAL